MNRIVFTNVNIFDGTGADTFNGEILVEDNRITRVSKNGDTVNAGDARVINGRGKFIMPGMTEAHVITSLPLDGPWPNGSVGRALDGVQVRLVGSDGLTDPGVEGERALGGAGLVAAQAKGRLIRREVTRVVTPGTLTDDNLLDPRQSNHLVSLSPPGNSRSAVGVAWVELSTGLFQAADVDRDRLGGY